MDQQNGSSEENDRGPSSKRVFIFGWIQKRTKKITAGKENERLTVLWSC